MNESGACGLTAGDVRDACGSTHPEDDFAIVLKVRLPDGRVVERGVTPRSVLPSVVDVVIEAEIELTEDDLADPGPRETPRGRMVAPQSGGS